MKRKEFIRDYILGVSPTTLPEYHFPTKLLQNNSDSGFFFGLPAFEKSEVYVGVPEDFEGNVLVVGGTGSGKSAGIIKPTTKAWGGTFCALDIKGELSQLYKRLHVLGVVNRPYIIFDFEDPGSYGYDIFGWMKEDCDTNLVSNLEEIAYTLIPKTGDNNEEFWNGRERSILIAALLYYFKKGLSFIQSVCIIADSNFFSLCKKLSSDEDIRIKNLIGDIQKLKLEQLAAIEQGLRNRVSFFISNPLVCNALRGNDGSGKILTWDNIQTHNIFLKVPEDKLQQLAPILNLMWSQLLHYLMRRPDKYSPDGANIAPVLLLLDEFAQLGRIDILSQAISTLRSRQVNLCLVIQSLAQLDKHYSTFERRVILDNCSYKAILNAGDPDTQEYLAKIIGTCNSIQRGYSQTFDSDLRCRSYGQQFNESRNWKIQPEELAYLRDEMILLSPFGVDKVRKFPGHELRDPFYLAFRQNETPKAFFSESEHISVPTVEEITATAKRIISKSKSSAKPKTKNNKQVDCVGGQNKTMIEEE